ncbi:MAG: cupin domain-containing protein [Gaiellaceae bacterium]|jgi:quercetin dioxygenase-like cupin family protein
MRKVIVIVTVAAAAVVTAIALATPASPPPVLVAETARGTFDVLPKFNTKFDNGGRVKLKVKGSVELISQKITAQPGATFGWHNHPGENFNVIWQGTLTLYHDEACTTGIDYGPGSAFSTHPQNIHLAKNNGTVDLVLFATYLAPKTTPPTPVRVDQPLPAAGCPQ